MGQALFRALVTLQRDRANLVLTIVIDENVNATLRDAHTKTPIRLNRGFRLRIGTLEWRDVATAIAHISARSAVVEALGTASGVCHLRAALTGAIAAQPVDDLHQTTIGRRNIAVEAGEREHRFEARELGHVNRSFQGVERFLMTRFVFVCGGLQVVQQARDLCVRLYRCCEVPPATRVLPSKVSGAP